jgi:glycosyltransferase involved in cell wall biosynthesis
VIVTSGTTAALLVADFAVPAGRITVAEPGTDPAPRSAASAAGSAALPRTVRLVAVGSVVPRKGYDLLVRALAHLSQLDWELVIAGDRDRSPATATGLEAQIGSCRLSGRVRLVGSLDEGALGELYASADLVVMPSLYEGYGMVLGEALARGLPIVATTGGAAAETVPDGAALKVPPGDTAALTAALRRAISDTGLRQRLADAAWAAGQKLPRWEDTARIVAGAIREAAP